MQTQEYEGNIPPMDSAPSSLFSPHFMPLIPPKSGTPRVQMARLPENPPPTSKILDPLITIICLLSATVMRLKSWRELLVNGRRELIRQLCAFPHRCVLKMPNKTVDQKSLIKGAGKHPQRLGAGHSLALKVRTIFGPHLFGLVSFPRT